MIGDRYEVSALLGRGGMGVVYTAHDRDLVRTVAIKVLPRPYCEDAHAVERFLRQARAMARIEHKSAVAVYERGLHAEMPYVVMERLAGRDLRELLRTTGHLPISRALALGIELCDAVHAAHQQQLVHRDLKPSNVFLAQAHGTEIIKLLDFGIAKIGDAAALTGAADVLGTLAYMAPELLASGSEASVQSDLYAVACIVFELVSGTLPFRASSRAELFARIERDPAPTLASRGIDAPAELDEVLARNFAKHPGERHRSAQELADALRAIWATLGAVAERGEDPPRRELANGRFRLLSRLGEGSFGVVYAALDARDGSTVALKRLRAVHSDDLYRLKREFRTLEDVVHPNLVRRYELWFEAGDAFFTMELIEGRSPREAWSTTERLKAGLRQLATGLTELHERGLVHRDLKPSNVLVDDSDRVVLLDFGLTAARGSQSLVGGTPSYVAPEALEGRISPAADMFAVGVMLYEMLTGQLPAAGAVLEQEGETASLALLCTVLLAADPDMRLSALEVIVWLDQDPAGLRAVPGERLAFVGRARELAVLRRAFADIADGSPRGLLISGESGIGKTALLASLQRELQVKALWLQSACRDSEVVPYPAIDGAIDALAEYLSTLPRESVVPLLPRNVHALAKLFPVLDRVEAIAERRFQHRLPRDPGQTRVLAYGALHGLLQRLCEQRPVVIAIDDVHWIDADSAALLAYVVGNPEPPPLLLLGTVRSDLAQTQSFRSLIGAIRVSASELTLRELDDAAGSSLVRSWLSGAGDTVDPQLLDRIVAEGGGHPFLLSTLAREAVERRGRELSLDSALASHWRGVSSAAQRLLEACAVCERPLPLKLLFDAVRGADAEVGAAGSRLADGRPVDHAAALELRRARLGRRVRVLGEESIEPYHARVREAVLNGTARERRQRLHRALANALRAHATDLAEALVEHLAASGEGAEAANVAIGAAVHASLQLAFDRAAALYAIAIEHGDANETRLAQWLAFRAGALRSAGRNVAGSNALLEASRIEAQPERARQLLRESGELLLFAGELERGLARLAPLLADVGLVLAKDANAAIAIGFEAFGALMERGLAPAERTEAPEPAAIEHLELSLTLANGLALIDMRGIPFAVSAMSSALELNVPTLLQRASATFVSLTAGLFFNPLIDPALALCRELTQALGTPHARALLCAAEGEVAHFSGRFLVAEASYEQAERILLESCVGAHRELASVRNGAVLIEYAQKGDFRSLLERSLGWQADAAARGDTFHENVLRVAHSIVWIAQDKVDKARRELELAATRWPTGGGAYEVGMLAFYDVLDRYEARDDVHLRPLQGREEIVSSPAAQTPFLAGYVHLQRAWGALRALANSNTRGDRGMVEAAIAGLRSLGPEIWQAVADAYQANLDFLAGARESALEHLAAAENRFRQLHMRCLAACARMRHGELSGGVFGSRLEGEAAAELRQLGVAKPDRFCQAYFSVFDPGLASELTLLTIA